ncbi:glycerol-3-phosphate 1-O-acyltransferase PlsY [candidate division WOR-3 bacterium]|nr:glycerol-3-phosphate 1-O-acyltransferase PlsY [candidate division WOR-3 bacterium]MCK4585409.1 glycerol-3-phosphate 1-O-acyltransferase PlsY [candidate division WOR-3 bacterium]
MEFLLSFIIGFFSGAIPFGFIIAKIKGIDIRRKGSGNIGFANVFRSVGKSEGIIVLILDISKGLLPVLLLNKYCGYYFGMIAGISAMLGHIFTPFLKFKGGKGVATGLGVFIGLAPVSALFSFIVWLLVFLISRYISLGSISAAVALPLFIYLSRFIIRDEYNIFLEILTILVCILVIVMHRSNIKRLIQGKERKLTLRKK